MYAGLERRKPTEIDYIEGTLTVKRKLNITPDGEAEIFVISKGDVEIGLTLEQAKSLGKYFVARIA